MKTTTKHYYQKRIKELETENEKLSNDRYVYRTLAFEIFDFAIETLATGNLSMSPSKVIRKFRSALK